MTAGEVRFQTTADAVLPAGDLFVDVPAEAVESGETGNVLTLVDEPGKRWTPAWYSGDPATENPDARFPRLTYGNSANNNQASTFWLANGRYLRLKNVDISYRWKNQWFQSIGISSYATLY